MRASQARRGSTLDEDRREVSARLRRRLSQIEEATVDRVRAIAVPAPLADPAYVAGIRVSVHDSIEYALRGLEAVDESPPPVPVSARLQARRAAHRGISLAALLRRYQAGQRLLSEFVIGEGGGLSLSALKQVLRSLDPLADQLTATIAADYVNEAERVSRTPAQKLRERVGRLLDGEGDTDPELAYELTGWHVGMIVLGAGTEDLVRELAAGLDCQSLVVPAGDDDVTWAWLGRRRKFSASDAERLLVDRHAAPPSVALGESQKGIEGWRLTHREARAALGVLLRRPQRVTRCRDVVLVSALMHDRALRKSLVNAYMEPLEGRGDYGRELRRTLRAYFAAEQNAVSTASALGVARHTVERRLRSVEEKLERPIGACSAQLQVALGVEELLGLAAAEEGEATDA